MWFSYVNTLFIFSWILYLTHTLRTSNEAAEFINQRQNNIWRGNILPIRRLSNVITTASFFKHNQRSTKVGFNYTKGPWADSNPHVVDWSFDHELQYCNRISYKLLRGNKTIEWFFSIFNLIVSLYSLPFSKLNSGYQNVRAGSMYIV